MFWVFSFREEKFTMILFFFSRMDSLIFRSPEATQRNASRESKAARGQSLEGGVREEYEVRVGAAKAGSAPHPQEGGNE